MDKNACELLAEITQAASGDIPLFIKKYFNWTIFVRFFDVRARSDSGDEIRCAKDRRSVENLCHNIFSDVFNRAVAKRLVDSHGKEE